MTLTDRVVDRGAAGTRSRTQWPMVARREIQVRLTDRNFLISTGVTLLMLILVFGVQAYFASSGPASYTVAVTDSSGAALVQQAEEALQEEDAQSVVTSTTVPDRAGGEELVVDGGADLLLVRGDGQWELGADGVPPSELWAALADVVRAEALQDTATQLGTTVEELTAGTELALVDLSGDNGSSEVVAFVATLVFAVLFYFAALMFGMAIASSVVEEKQSRIVEILSAIIPVRQLLTGKVVGNTLLALGQLLLIVGVGLIGVTFTDFDVMLPGMTSALLWYIPFFVAGFLALACIWAAAGALSSRTEDLQSTTMPVSMALVLILFVGIGVEGVVRQVASFVPVVSTIVMPGRVLAGEALWWEPVLALALTLAFAALTIAAGGRLYRRALLQTQGRVSWRTAWRTRA